MSLKAEDKQEKSFIVLEYFGRDGCSHCNQAKEFLEKLRLTHPNLIVIENNISSQPETLSRLQNLANKYHLKNIAVPAFYVNEKIVVGFASEATTGKKLEKIILGKKQRVLIGGREPLVVSGSCSSETTSGDPGSSSSCVLEPNSDDELIVDLPLLGRVNPKSWNPTLFTVTLGAIDGFNSCAMWVLLFLLSLLVNLKDRKKMFIISGIFVFVSGLVYFAFMAAWLNFFLVVGLSKTVQAVLGVLALMVGLIHIKDFFAFHRGFSLSIPDSVKPGIYQRVHNIITAKNLPAAIFSVTALAVMVNMVELLCTAGLPVIYTHVLASHNVARLEYYGYLALYNVAYMLDDSIMLFIAVVTLSKNKLQEKAGRWLKLISGSSIAALGLLLIFKPEWLNWY